MESSLELFYSYAQQDEPLRNILETYLQPLKRQYRLITWHRQEILAGKNWAQEINTHLNSAHIILLLISPDFLASDYCYSTEMQRAIERHNAGTAHVIPILLRPSDWRGASFAQLQPLPKNEMPITRWPDRDEAFLNVAQGIRLAIEDFQKRVQQNRDQIQRPEYQAVSTTMPTLTDNVQQQISGLERPATVFLNFRQEDAQSVKHLQQHLQIRGLRIWRSAWQEDAGHTLSHAAQEERIRVIEQEADACILYITPASLTISPFWTIEASAALQRRERDHTFQIIPVLEKVTMMELEQFYTNHNLSHFKQMQGNLIPETEAHQPESEVRYREALTIVARQVLRAALASRLHRVKAGSDYQPSLSLYTFHQPPPQPVLDLEMNWWDIFQDRERLPTEDEWQHLLVPAVEDVKHVLAEQSISRSLHISMQAILPVGFAFGFLFPATSSFTLLPLSSKDGEWSTAGTPSQNASLQETFSENDGDPHTAIVEMNISANVSSAVSLTLINFNISCGYRLSFTLPNGPDHLTGVKDPSHALSIAHQIGKTMKRLRNEKNIQHIHLFAALPVALALLIGYQWNTLCPITLYEYMKAEGLYRQAWTLK